LLHIFREFMSNLERDVDRLYHALVQMLPSRMKPGHSCWQATEYQNKITVAKLCPTRTQLLPSVNRLDTVFFKLNQTRTQLLPSRTRLRCSCCHFNSYLDAAAATFFQTRYGCCQFVSDKDVAVGKICILDHDTTVAKL
jgi:hypothetical protein